MANLKEAVIVSACRTAIGEFLGSLKGVSMSDMAAICLKEAAARVGLDTKLIDDNEFNLLKKPLIHFSDPFCYY